jgi:16S rRNA (adenine1518-N6/adenine1519-N6)-dimethyltransferase
VANLPYYAASPIIRRFLEADSKPSVMVVMVQREVAQSMAASPGKMGILSVAIQVYGRPRVVCNVPPRAFRPSPKVTSSVVRIDVYEAPAVAFDSPEGFFRLVRAGFSAPRKQIHNCLRRGLDVPPEVAREMLAMAGIDPMRRAQTLSLQDWGGLYQAFRTLGLSPASA